MPGTTPENPDWAKRKVIPATPPQVEYALTPSGQSLQGTLGMLAAWSAQNHDAIRVARAAYDSETVR